MLRKPATATTVLRDNTSRRWTSILAVAAILATGAIGFVLHYLKSVTNPETTTILFTLTALAHSLTVFVPVIAFNLTHALSLLATPRKAARAAPQSYRAALPHITVLIPMRNEPFDLITSKSIKSVIRADYPADRLHVVIVDNSSHLSHYLQYERYARRLRRSTSLDIVCCHREGIAGRKGRNLNIGIGMKQIDGRYLAVRSEIFVTMDADIEFEADTLRRVVSEFVNNARLPFASLKVIDRASDNSFNDTMGFNNSVDWGIIPAIEETGINTFWGQCTFFRREAILDIGGFPEDKLLEDIGSGLRIRALDTWDSGLRIDYAVAYDSAPETLSRYKMQQQKWAAGYMELIYDGLLRRIFAADHVTVTEKLDLVFRLSHYPRNALNYLLFPLVYISILLNSAQIEFRHVAPMAGFMAVNVLGSTLTQLLVFAAAKKHGSFSSYREALKFVPLVIYSHCIGIPSAAGVLSGLTNFRINRGITPKGRHFASGLHQDILSNRWEIIYGLTLIAPAFFLSVLSIPPALVGSGLILSVFAHRFGAGREKAIDANFIRSLFTRRNAVWVDHNASGSAGRAPRVSSLRHG